MLNWNLLSNPANWLTVFLMLAIAMIAASIIHQRTTLLP